MSQILSSFLNKLTKSGRFFTRRWHELTTSAPRYRGLNREKFGHNNSPSNYQLVKERPSRLQDDFVLVEDRRTLDQIFLRLRGQFCDPSVRRTKSLGKKTIIKETGKLDPDRLYFYLKPLNQSGWLFERSGSGWLVSRAEKIVGQNTFMRSHEPWDRVTVFDGKSGKLNAPRITSDRLGAELVSFAVYEEKLRSTITEEIV